ncbi:MAG: nucleotidyltransferase [Spirochaetes bacterium]|nr:nucleotidyltransferase [Spirochaetota bacterium]
MKPTLVVMAAGMGSRYGGIKQIDPVGPSGEALLDYSVYDALRAGFQDVVFIIRQSIDADFRAFCKGRFSNVPYQIVYQELEDIPVGFSIPEGRTKPWGTTHAILRVREVVKNPFAVINADDFYGRNAYEILQSYLSQLPVDSKDFALVGYRLENTLSEHGSVSRGICSVDSAGYLLSVEEYVKIIKKNGKIESIEPSQPGTFTGKEFASMNMFGFTPSLFPLIEREFLDFLKTDGKDPKSECYIPRVIGKLVQRKEIRVKVLPSTSSWFGITYQADKPVVKEKINQLIASGEYPPQLWKP